MIADTMRPDDRELMRQAARRIRQVTGAPVVFGGLRRGREIPIRTTLGARTDFLTSITVQPSRGLGGLSWLAGRPMTVAEYGHSSEISHDFDRQILGEGIITLSAAPIIVGREVRGLLYAGSRTDAGRGRVGSLVTIAAGIAEELRIRDLVDERVAMRNRALSESAVLGSIRAEIALLARTTRDPETARRLRTLASEPPGPRDDVALTPRQRAVLQLVAHGLSNAQVAERLSLSELTVKSYLRAAMPKLGARSRLQAVAEAQKRGIL